MLLAASVGLWACGGDADMLTATPDDDSPAAPEPGMVTFSASQYNGSLSKRYFVLNNYDNSAETTTAQFSGDDITVFGSDGAPYVFRQSFVSSDRLRANFSGRIPTAEKYYALLPFNDTATIKGNVISAVIPSEQDVWNGTSDLAVATATDADRSFQFKNVCSMIKFSLNGYFERIEVEATDGTKIAGSVDISVADDGTPTVTPGKDAVSKVSWAVRGYGGSYYAVSLIPTTVKAGSLRITFVMNDGTSYARIIDHDVTLERGVIYDFGATGRYKLTCYKDEMQDEQIFSMYTQSGNPDYLCLPVPDAAAPAGKVYIYTDRSGNNSWRPSDYFELRSDTTLYLRIVNGYKLTIYGDGPDKPATLDTLVARNTSFNLPQTAVTMPDGKVLSGYSETPDGELNYGYGSIWIEDKDLSLYPVFTDLYTIKVYNNGADKAPTDSLSYSGNSYYYYLPNIPFLADEGKVYGYATSPNGKIEYMPYARAVFKGSVNLYPVMGDAPTGTVSMPGNTEEWTSEPLR